MNYKLVFILTTLSFAALATHAATRSLCSAMSVKSHREGSMPIPENAFTEQAARGEYRKLNKIFGVDAHDFDSVALENTFVIIEGWHLKRQALKERKRSGTLISNSSFCVFMKDRAFVRH